MWVGIDWRFGRASACALGFGLLACSGLNHDCIETRDCPEPGSAIDVGGDEWWNTGGAGQTEFPADGADAGAAGTLDRGAPDAGEGGGSSAAPVSEAPRVVQVSPADGALGVRSDAALVVVFSRAMNPISTEAAYHSDDLPAAQLSFAWNEDHTSLTLTPRNPLLYATASEGQGLDEVVAQAYHYGFGDSARDELGQSLLAVDFRLSTLRQFAIELAADPERSGNWTDRGAEGIHNCLRHAKAPYAPTVCVGDDASGARYTGFLSFDLRPMPAEIAGFSSVRLIASGTAYGTLAKLGPNELGHVVFGDLGQAALEVAPSASLGSFLSGVGLASGDHFELSDDLTSAVSDDYVHRAVRSNQSQYRLGFSKVFPDGHWDDVELPTASIRLRATYLIP
jgi:hypothetical protein